MLLRINRSVRKTNRLCLSHECLIFINIRVFSTLGPFEILPDTEIKHSTSRLDFSK